MTTDGAMSFRGFIFPNNPAVIRIVDQRNIAVRQVPYGTACSEDMGRQCRVITGEGDFYGEDCLEIFEQLRSVMMQGGGGMLYVPSQNPMYVFADQLELTGNDVEGVVSYRFRFIEAVPREDQEGNLVVLGDGKSCLWDYAYRYAVNIDLLGELNPHIRQPDIPVMPGERVYLC